VASVAGAPIKGKVIRVIKTDTCGAPISGGSSAQIVSNSFVSVAMAPQIEDGTEFFVRTADGTPCVNDKDAPILKRMQLTVILCSIDPDMTPLILSARELTTTAPVSGTGFALQEGAPTAHFSFETWQTVAGAGACAPGGAQYFVYHAWPHCKNPQIQDYTVENGVSQLQFLCETIAPSTNWLAGQTWLGTNNPIQSLDHWLWNLTTNAPPTAGVGLRSYP
jgi:hypothetical protein